VWLVVVICSAVSKRIGCFLLWEVACRFLSSSTARSWRSPLFGHMKPLYVSLSAVAHIFGKRYWWVNGSISNCFEVSGTSFQKRKCRKELRLYLLLSSCRRLLHFHLRRLNIDDLIFILSLDHKWVIVFDTAWVYNGWICVTMKWKKRKHDVLFLLLYFQTALHLK